MTERIDAHHHLWRYNPGEYGWIGESMARLRRDFLPFDLEAEAYAAKVDGTVAVQARQSIVETSWLLDLAVQSPIIRGVVGWAPIAHTDFEAQLDGIRANPKLKGLRHVIHDEPDENYLLRADFNHGIAALHGTGLVYDILIFERHLPQVIQFVDRHPKQVFVLDHIAKPRIAEQLIEPWRQHISELATRQNVYCKVSGMVTEAQWERWDSEDLKPYWGVVLDAFGPRRLMMGSDWPVCLVASSYARWLDTLKGWMGELSADEQDRVLGGTAIEVYDLQGQHTKQECRV